MKIQPILLCLSFICVNCSSIHRVSQPEDANQRIGGDEARIILRDGREMLASAIYCAKDSATAVTTDVSQTIRFATADIWRIRRENRFRGVVGGLVPGALVSGALGYGVAVISAGLTSGDRAVGAWHLGVAIFRVGATIGVVAGFLSGHKTGVEFIQDSTSVQERAVTGKQDKREF